MAEDPASISKFLDNLLSEKNEDGYIKVSLFNVSSSTLQNHQFGNYGTGQRCYITAEIHPQDVDMQRIVTPNEPIRQALCKYGFLCDEAALLVPVEFGGMDYHKNLYLQSKYVSLNFRFLFYITRE